MPKTVFLYDSDEMLHQWQQIADPVNTTIATQRALSSVDETASILDGYDTCINDATFFPDEQLRLCSTLRHIVFLGTGASSFIDLEAAAFLGIKVSTIKGYGDVTVAEHTVGLIFAAARDIVAMDRKIRRGGWGPNEGLELRGKVLGIVGLGGVGREMARLADGIGMPVIAWNRSPVTNGSIALVTLDELLRRADIISLHLALTPETANFIDRERIATMKRGAILINTARAGLVDTVALAKALQSGHLRHAGIDVFEPEPPRADNLLLKLENVTLTAHAGAMTPEAIRNLLRRAVALATKGFEE